jgi:ribosome-binding protein aMBF1 (putative translation factor)
VSTQHRHPPGWAGAGTGRPSLRILIFKRRAVLVHRSFGIAAAPEANRKVQMNEHWERVQDAARYLRRRREEQDLSREALAQRLQIKASHLASIERGETDPRSSVLVV